MITDGFTYLAVLIGLGGALRYAQHASRNKFFDYVPPIVLLYFGVMVLSTLGLWTRSETIDATYTNVKGNLLPAMIFLMLLKSDLRQIRKLGRKMLIGFFAASTSIAIGFVVAFSLFHTVLQQGAWKTFAALAGSWMGGTGNMAAIQGALNVPDSSMGYTLLIDSIDYAIWVVLLLALVPLAPLFNKWSVADTRLLDEIGGKLGQEVSSDKSINATDLLFLTGLSLLVSAIVQALAVDLPGGAFMTATTWTVLIVTVLGVLAASTRLGRMSGSAELATVMLYVIVALIASRANFAELAQAPIYIVAGFVILAVHGVLMLGAAKLFRLDLFTCGIASLANIGGVASAPILAAAYSQVLVPIGVLMAMLGYIIGTAGGLLVGRVLSLIAS
ncbi:MAG: DUF819 family protein [Desulfobulbaceae bacterium]|nr:DUF819 family protein [Desulfobulbaceae bacterium]